MKKLMDFISSRPFTYTLYAAGLVLFFVSSGLWRWPVLAALAFYFFVNRAGTGKPVQRIGLPLAVIALVGLCFPQSAKALLGEDIPILLSQLAELEQQVAETVQLYHTAQQDYQLAQTMAQAIRSKNLFAIQQAVRMGNAYVADHYGESAMWPRAMNLGASIPIAYQNATVQPQISDDFFAAEQLQKSGRLAALARVGITDDVNQRIMGAVSQINQQQTTNASAVGQWQRSVMSQDDDLNTAAQQNLTNIGMMHLYEQGRANLAVNSLLTQSLMVQNMQQRDAAVSHLNFVQDLQTKQAQAPVLGGFDTILQRHSLY